MAIALHRIMTFKSKLGSSNYKDNTIEELIALNKQSIILKAYFTKSNVDFSIDVLVALKMQTQHQIPKPGTDWERFNPVLKELYPGQHNRIYNKIKTAREKRMTKLSRVESKSSLRNKNQR